MTITINLKPDLEARLRDFADRAGQDPVGLVQELVEAELPDRLSRPTQPPAWLADLKPANPPAHGTNGMDRVFGKWPGDETDQQIQSALDELS